MNEAEQKAAKEKLLKEAVRICHRIVKDCDDDVAPLSDTWWMSRDGEGDAVHQTVYEAAFSFLYDLSVIEAFEDDDLKALLAKHKAN